MNAEQLFGVAEILKSVALTKPVGKVEFTGFQQTTADALGHFEVTYEGYQHTFVLAQSGALIRSYKQVVSQYDADRAAQIKAAPSTQAKVQ